MSNQNLNENYNNEIKEENDNMNTSSNISLNSKEMSIDQIRELLKQNGVDPSAITIKPTRQIKKIDHLTYEDGLAICQHNAEHKFDLSTLDEELKERCKKFGLCPDCLEILNKATEIKKDIKASRTVTPRAAGMIAPMVQLKEIIKSNIMNFNDEIIEKLVNKEFCKKMSLSYSLFLDITDKTQEEINIIKKDKKGRNRYGKQVYLINGRNYLLCNDIYDRNIVKILNVLSDLGIK